MPLYFKRQNEKCTICGCRYLQDAGRRDCSVFGSIFVWPRQQAPAFFDFQVSCQTRCQAIKNRWLWFCIVRMRAAKSLAVTTRNDRQGSVVIDRNRQAGVGQKVDFSIEKKGGSDGCRWPRYVSEYAFLCLVMHAGSHIARSNQARWV